MGTYVTTCGHCGARSSALVIRTAEPTANDGYRWNCMLVCGSCGEGSIAQVRVTASNVANPAAFPGDIGSKPSHYEVLYFFPRKLAGKAPEHVPPAAAAAFAEGVDNLNDGRFTSAIMMFRRALDVGLKEFPSEIDAWKLEKRIDKLADAGLITKDLQQWAHKIRLEGNEAVHELDNPTKEQAGELRLFTELVLIYLFTLPARVKANLPADNEA